MDKQFPDMPTVPMPVARPERIRRKPWLIILIVVGFLVILGIGVSVLNKISGTTHPQTSNRAQATGIAATQTGQSANTATAGNTTGTPASSQATAPAQRSTPTPTPPLSSISHGRPHLGGPFSDFIGAYGQPTPQGDSNSLNFWTGPNQSIDINAQRNEQGIVTQLNILGPNTWNIQQTQSYCIQFLPDNAVQFSATGNLIKYHSNSGDVALNLQVSSCLLSFA